MNLYLTIITTVLVMTQIIRVTQNAIQLKHFKTMHKDDDYIYSTYKKLNKALDIYLTVEDGYCEDCKYTDYDEEEEPCKKCKNNHISYFEMREEDDEI